MITISTSYNIEWTLENYPNYGVTKDGVVINLQRNTILKKCVVGYSKGFYLDKKFITTTKLRTMLIKVKKVDCPF